MSDNTQNAQSEKIEGSENTANTENIDTKQSETTENTENKNDSEKEEKFTVDLTTNAKAKEFFLQGLRNQHAVEKQAISTIETQLGRYEHYVDLHSQMQIDLRNSKVQLERIEELLARNSTSASTTKETVTSIVGTVAGLVHITADDQVVKDTFAAAGYKQYEIVAYKSLIGVAQAIGDTSAATVLEESLEEEEAVSEWFQEHTAAIVLTHLKRYVNEA